MAARLVVRRRRDGLVQLRRRRFWHVVSTPETVAILFLFLTCGVISVALIATLLVPPLVLAALPVIPVALVGIWAARATQAPAFVIAPLDGPPRPPRRVA